MHLLDGASGLLESFVGMVESNVKPILMIDLSFNPSFRFVLKLITRKGFTKFSQNFLHFGSKKLQTDEELW
jgi:hypothetical protein